MSTGVQTPVTELPKQYRPAEHEGRAWQRWIDAHAFDADPDRVLRGEARPYCVLIPPPNVTAALHLGHALNNTLQDVLVRAHRMMGFEALWMPGTDHAGIATQAVVEKRVWNQEKKRRTDFSRDEFIAKIQAFKDEYEATITGQLKAMGCSCDWRRQRFTMDSVCARAVREAFFRLFRDGLIYRGKRLVNWDTVLQTAVADDECYDEEIDGAFYYLRYPLVHKGANDPATATGGENADAMPVTWGELATRGYPGAESLPPDDGAWITVATTRPETYLGDTGVAINPHDPRVKALRGLFCELPLVGRVIPIVEDSYVVLPERYARTDEEKADPKASMATGFLKVTPAHDPNDAEIGRRHNLEAINMMSPDGKVSASNGWTDIGDAHLFVGKSMRDARKLVVKEFEARGLLEGQKPHRHSVKHSDRSKAVIEPYLSDQWYVKVTDPRLAARANAALAPEQREFRPRPDEPNEPRPSGSGIHPQPNEQPVDRGYNSPTPRPSPRVVFYLITFTTYGTWLHGDTRGSVDRDHNAPGTPYLSPDDARRESEHSSLQHPPFTLEAAQRPVVAAAIAEVCAHRGWSLRACNVRTNHVHVVVAADQPPERVMNDFKAYATRALRRAEPGLSEYVWTRHGSTRYLNSSESIAGAVRYVLDEQGDDLGGVLRGAPDARPVETHRAGSSVPPPLPHGRGSLDAPDSSGDGTMRFFPARYAKTFEQWHDNIRDWCISRQLWWGHRIPVWYIKGINPTDSQYADTYDVLRQWESDGRIAVQRRDDRGHIETDPVRRALEGIGGLGNIFVCVRYSNDADVISWLEANSTYAQDPDVLDTWFSSALWPLSTLGWPDAAQAAKDTGVADFPNLLDAFNPTSTLCTAREIITLWVSRMVMFNRYLHAPGAGPPPFRHVFIHAVIQDGEGRKMSKSLGNGVDPLDIIATHGADAMRFTLCQMATNTQDVRLPVAKGADGRNTSPKFDLGRNFATKLWNATRFAMEKLGSGDTATQRDSETGANAAGANSASLSRALASLSLPDRWILSRLATTIAACDKALANYEFAEYAQACYTFLWNDFCDWYLEAIKPTVATDAGQQGVLRAVLDATLRLLHPVMPFVTETIYEALAPLPAPAVPGLLLGPPRKGGLLATAGWPVADAALRDESAEALFGRVQTLVTAVREVRAQHSVHFKRAITLHIPDEARATLGVGEPIVAALANLGTITPVVPSAQSVPISVDGREFRLSDLADAADAVDAGAERSRLSRLVADLTKSKATLEGRLANPGYTDKAPAHMVQQTRDQLTKVTAELAAAQDALNALPA